MNLKNSVRGPYILQKVCFARLRGLDPCPLKFLVARLEMEIAITLEVFVAADMVR